MKKFVERRQHGFWVRCIQPARCEAVDFAVAGIAQRDEVAHRVVTVRPFVAETCTVDMVDGDLLDRGALNAGEVVAAQGFQMVGMAMLGDQLGAVSASGGAVERAGAFALGGLSADFAGERHPARRAGFRARVARLVLLTAAIARLRVFLETHVSPASLTRLAAALGAVANRKRRAARNAISAFHSADSALIGSA